MDTGARVGQAIAGLESKLVYVIHVQELETEHSDNNFLSSSKAVITSSVKNVIPLCFFTSFCMLNGKSTRARFVERLDFVRWYIMHHHVF